MPLGRVHWTRDEKGKNLLQNQIINEIAKNHQVSPAQVLLRVGVRNRQSYQIIEYSLFHFSNPNSVFKFNEVFWLFQKVKISIVSNQTDNCFTFS